MLSNKSDYLLIIEDSEAEVSLLSYAFELNKFQSHIKFERFGHKAISLLENPAQHNPRLIIMDLSLPDMDGFDLLRNIKEHPDLHEIPVLIRSGSNNPKNRIKCLDLGAVDFIEKPMDLDILVTQVSQLIQYWNALPIIP